jgi:imidazolonepropionase-like amidohydrolase
MWLRCSAAIVLLTWLGFADVAIVGARVMDGSGAPPIAATVVVKRNRIAALLPEGTIPEEVAVVRADGKLLTPGLFDLHTHLLASGVEGHPADWGKNLKAYLYSGVTTVVDLSTYAEQFEPMRRLSAEGLPAPRLHLASRFGTPAGHGLEGGRGDFHTQEIWTPAEARASVRRVLKYRPDVLKVFSDGWRYGLSDDMTSMPERTLAAIVEEAHREGVKVVTHTVTLQKSKEAVRAGVDILVHGIGDSGVDEEFLGLLRAKRTGYVSTLAVYQPMQQHPAPNELLSAVLTPTAFEKVQPVTRPVEAARAKRWLTLQNNLSAIRAGGGLVGCGTDAGMGGTYHGWATIRELQLMIESGASPLQALAAATGASARLLGVDADRGFIGEGKLADMVLFDGDPMANAADFMRIARVWIDGKEVDRAGIAGAIRSDELTQMKPRELPRLLDSFESVDGRSAIDTLWVNSTDGGHDHTKMMYARTMRGPNNHALTLLVEMPAKGRAHGAMILPLSPGMVEPANLRPWSYLEFDARGEGNHELLFLERGRRSGDAVRSPFTVGPRWKKVRIGLPDTEALGFEFRTEREPGAKSLLEIDNVRLVK